MQYYLLICINSNDMLNQKVINRHINKITQVPYFQNFNRFFRFLVMNR
jgi:hypothetical protein